MRPKRARGRAGKASGRQGEPSGMPHSVAPPMPGALSAVTELLGGRRVFRELPTTGIALHEAIRRGFPVRALVYMLDHTTHIPRSKFAAAVGANVYTARQRALSSTARLNQNQSARLWRLARVLRQAAEVLGGRDEAERWLCSPALALEQRAPIDLLRTAVGAELVEELLMRLAWGVYT